MQLSRTAVGSTIAVASLGIVLLAGCSSSPPSLTPETSFPSVDASSGATPTSSASVPVFGNHELPEWAEGLAPLPASQLFSTPIATNTKLQLVFDVPAKSDAEARTYADRLRSQGWVIVSSSTAAGESVIKLASTDGRIDATVTGVSVGGSGRLIIEAELRSSGT